MPQRTQITLDTEQHRRVRRRAAELGVSMAAYLRSIIDRELRDDGPRADVSAILDLGDSRVDGAAPQSDVAEHKDAYLREAVEAFHPRR
jgi:predicted DNA-binding protein